MHLTKARMAGCLACSTMIYGAALRSVEPYSLNTIKKIAYFMGAETFVAIGLRFFPLHQVIKRAFTQENQDFATHRATQVALFALATSSAAILFRKAIPVISSYKLAFSFIAFCYIYSSVLQTISKHIFMKIAHPTTATDTNSTNRLIHRATQIGVVALLVISYVQKKALKSQVPSLNSDATRKLKAANFATFAFGIIVFRGLVSKATEVAFPAHVW